MRKITQLQFNMFKNCKVALISTTEEINPCLYIRTLGAFGDRIEKSLQLSTNDTFIRNIHLINSGNAATNDQSKYKFFNLYILSDDWINYADWFVDTKANTLHQSSGSNRGGFIVIDRDERIVCDKAYCKKVISTTDYLFMNDMLPAPPMEFVEEYIAAYNKGNQITEVMVAYETEIITSIKSPKIDLSRNEIIMKDAKSSWTRDEVISLAIRIKNTFGGSELYDYHSDEEVIKWLNKNEL